MILEIILNNIKYSSKSQISFYFIKNWFAEVLQMQIKVAVANFFFVSALIKFSGNF